MITFNPKGKKVILSIDGGGMRGIIPLAMLAHLEEQTGKPAYELFDMVAGTSTGAIIGAGLGLGLTARQLLDDIYKDRLAKEFARQRDGFSFWIRYFFRFLRYAYDLRPFVEMLGVFAAGKKIKDLGMHNGQRKLIVLMLTKDVRTSNTYYVVNAGPGAVRFQDWPVKGAVAASGSAPIFFQAVLGNLIDGGIGAYGNPCLVASLEAMEYIAQDPAYADFRPDNTIHYSLGTGFVSTNIRDGEAADYWLKPWIEYTINESIDDAALQQAYATKLVYKDLDFRRYNPDLDRKVVETELGVSTIGLNPASFGLDAYRRDELDLLERIGRAYAEAIDWNNPATNMPWLTRGGHPQPSIAPVNWSGTIYER